MEEVHLKELEKYLAVILIKEDFDSSCRMNGITKEFNLK